MSEYRIYLVKIYNNNLTPKEVEGWNNERFIEEAENQGFVYSPEGFQSEWNRGDVPYCDLSYMRILPVDAK